MKKWENAVEFMTKWLYCTLITSKNGETQTFFKQNKDTGYDFRQHVGLFVRVLEFLSCKNATGTIPSGNVCLKLPQIGYRK